MELHAVSRDISYDKGIIIFYLRKSFFKRSVDPVSFGSFFVNMKILSAVLLIFNYSELFSKFIFFSDYNAAFLLLFYYCVMLFQIDQLIPFHSTPLSMLL
jgi:hypothetical protein